MAGSNTRGQKVRELGRKALVLLLVISLLMLVALPDAKGQPHTSKSNSVRITDAYYADLDNDGCEDDIKILVEFFFPDSDPSRVDLNLWISLPSGLVYNFRVSVYRAPPESVLQIDCIDMATESGWYTITMLASIMGAGNGKMYITDEFSFDPPTGGGPGLPTVYAYF